MATADSAMFSRLLKQSILTLCKEAVPYDHYLEIDGIVCITRDGGAQQVVKVHEMYQRVRQNQTDAATGDNSTFTVEVKQETQSPNVHHQRAGSPEVPSTSSNGRQASEIEQDTDRQGADNSSAAVTGSINEITQNTELNNNPTVTQSGGNENDVMQQTENITDRHVSLKKVKLELFVKPDTEILKLDAKYGIDRSLPPSTDTDILCKTCTTSLANGPAFENHVLIEHGQYACYVCLKTFTSRTNMRRHQRLHTGTRPFKCPKCPETFARKDEVNRHALRHNHEKPFRCAICQMRYAERSGIKKHMQNQHKSLTVSICPNCGEGFSNAKAFQDHKKTHDVFREFGCKVCNFVGSNPLMLQKHMLEHGQIKTYNCPNCETSFTDAFVYTEHLKSHKTDISETVYPCCFCDVVLSSFEQFQRHEQQTHVRAKVHTCVICQKQFNLLSSFKKHMLAHKPSVTATATTSGAQANNMTVTVSMLEQGTSGSREYWCTECQQGFGSEFQLQAHIMNTHEGDRVVDSRDNTNSAFKTPFSASQGGSGTQSREINIKKGNKVTGLLSKLKNKIKIPANATKSVYEESTQMDNGTAYEQNTQLDGDAVYEGERVNRNNIYDEATQEVPDIVSSSERRWVFYREGCNHSVDKGAPNNNTAIAASSPSAGGKTEHDTNSGLQPLPNGTTRSNVNNNNSNVIRKGGEVPKNASGLLVDSNKTDKNDAKVKEKHESKTARPTMPKGDPLSDTIDGASLPNITIKRRNTPDNTKQKMNHNKSADTKRNETNPTQMTGDSGGEFGFKRPKLAEAGKSVFDRPFNQSSSTCTASAGQSSSTQYSKSYDLGMDTELSSTPNLSSPNADERARQPGVDNVVTPEVLFSMNASFICEKCDVKFTDFANFNIHCSLVHQTFVCEYCGKYFTSRPNRDRHLRYHTGKKPYKCVVCNETFFRVDDLKYHTTSKHTFKLYYCGACDKSFAFINQLEKHFTAFPEHRQSFAYNVE